MKKGKAISAKQAPFNVLQPTTEIKLSQKADKILCSLEKLCPAFYAAHSKNSLDAAIHSWR
jgi:hypothetical protein